MQGCVDALLKSPSLNRLLATDPDIRRDVDAIVANLDGALRKVCDGVRLHHSA